ncbi:Morn repeat protein [Pandoravirus kuranda]|uniref:Morn repeat protein n=1 Tax=Pandoravirus kuranda TaxID=3019033 RepID=A0AA95J434_9VIRU|nr:Morn repeat protein [Pandoravirus kuranda]
MSSDTSDHLSIEHMPNEIIWSVARYLMAGATIRGFVDMWHLATTCRSLAAALLDDDAMWASHVRASFPEPFSYMHSDPHAFGERWMRVYARLTRLVDQDRDRGGDAIPICPETGLVYVPVHLCGAPHSPAASRLQNTVYESAFVTDCLLACGTIVNDQLEGYGALCAAQHTTHAHGTRDTGPTSHIPVVLLEGIFRGDRLHGRGILRREQYAPPQDEPYDARGNRRRQAIHRPHKCSALCRCTECMGDVFVQHDSDSLFGGLPCSHGKWITRCDSRHCCKCAVRWCKACRLRDCRQKCTDPARACASCTARLHARAAKHFLARLDAFDGTWDDGMPHGYGKAVFQHGVRYDGPWHRGLPHGRGLVDGVERQWFMGTLLPCARLDYPTRDGRATAVYEGDVKPRQLTVGSLCMVEAVPHFDDLNRSSTLRRLSWKEYARHGHGTMHYVDGSIFQGDWIGDARRRGRMLHPNGLVLEGTWERGGSGTGTVSWPDGRTDTGASWDAVGRVQ